MSILKNAALLFVSFFVALIGVEFALRAVLDEVNYMKPVTERHATLGHTIVPGTGGHDDWGFRNVSVPESAEVVAIGDSMTYGFSATAAQSWPAQLAALSGQRVYNLSLGGYGPLQYLQLLKEKSLTLKPRTVLVGLYLGNDMWDAYHAARGFEEGSTLTFAHTRGRFLGDFRVWLSRNSLTYQVAKYELEGMIRTVRFAEMSAMNRPGYYPFEHPILQTILRPVCCMNSLDPESELVQGGYQATVQALQEIDAVCGANGIDCHFLIFPTKETVYWPIAEPSLSAEAKAEVAKLVAAEELLRQRLSGFLEENGLSYLDLLEPLRAASESQAIYLPNEDGHPNGHGYAVIAKAVFDWLQASPEMPAGTEAAGAAAIMVQ